MHKLFTLFLSIAKYVNYIILLTQCIIIINKGKIIVEYYTIIYYKYTYNILVVIMNYDR